MTAAPPKIRLGELLRARMRQCRLPQCELAKALAISPAAVSQLLSGRRSFRYSLLLKTCDLLQLGPAEREEAFRLLGDIRSGDPAGIGADRPFPFAAGTSGDMVAEKKSDWRDFGSLDMMRRMSGRKPMSSMRSASSSTKHSTWSR